MATTWDTSVQPGFLTYSNGNKTCVSTDYSMIQATKKILGKKYWETSLDGATNGASSAGLGVTLPGDPTSDVLQFLLFVQSTSWTAEDNFFSISVGSGSLPSSLSHCMQIAYDQPNNLLYLGVDGTWLVGDPVAETGGYTLFGGVSTDYFPQGEFDNASASFPQGLIANFGATPFAFTRPPAFAPMDDAIVYGFDQSGDLYVPRKWKGAGGTPS